MRYKKNILIKIISMNYRALPLVNSGADEMILITLNESTTELS